MELNQPWLTAIRFESILDIGAHTGGWSRTVRAIFPQASIYAFEPLPDSYQVCTHLMKAQTKFKAFNVALGDRNGTTAFHKSSFRPASSILKISEGMRSVIPTREAESSEIIEVELKRLDSLVDEIPLSLPAPMLVKIDVQGYEDHIIRGGMITLSKADVVIIETSFSQLYAGQVLFEDISDMLKCFGLCYRGSIEQFSDPFDGKILQQDSLFVRANSK